MDVDDVGVFYVDYKEILITHEYKYRIIQRGKSQLEYQLLKLSILLPYTSYIFIAYASKKKTYLFVC